MRPVFAHIWRKMFSAHVFGDGGFDPEDGLRGKRAIEAFGGGEDVFDLRERVLSGLQGLFRAAEFLVWKISNYSGI